MERNAGYTRERVRQLGERMRALIYPQTIPVESLKVAGPVDRISYDEAQRITGFRDAVMGEQFGPQWATFWFRAKAEVPKEWAGKRVDLLWESHSEATLWIGGRAVQGLNHNPRSWDGSTRPDAVLRDGSGAEGETIEFQIEMACNKLFGNEGNYGQYRHLSPYVLDRCDIALFDPEAWDLFWDFNILQELEADGHRGKSYELDYAWAGRLLAELNEFANLYDPEDRSTWPKAREILAALYEMRNATFHHEQWAIGHAHIDTAWLWPLAETHRKCERTFSSQTTYMESYPEYKFACSQAYQYEVIKQRNPDLYARIKARVESGQWIPVGGTWVEPDCNIPSGESLIRQFLVGQSFFRKEFGKTCREFWNPDVFGYNGQLPQIIRLGGATRFLTQKLSWNRFNKPFHHTFLWQGIDGTEVLTHFPPMDTYNARVTPSELRFNAKNFKDDERSDVSLILFGFGDGGGGPTKAMLERIRRARDLEGIPPTHIGTVDGFFSRLESTYTDPTRHVGELYFEFHRGTYTTQAATKRGNRKGEFALHDAEFLSLVAFKSGKDAYPYEKLDELWKLLLLNQFHDILPGSSITLVYEDTARDHAKVISEANELTADAASALTSTTDGLVPLNTIGFERAEVAPLPDGSLVFVETPPYGFGEIVEAPDRVASLDNGDGTYVLENAQLRAILASDGTLHSLIEKATRREALAGTGNQFVLYEDRPTSDDAWDVDPFHLETRRPAPAAVSHRIVEQDPLRASVEFEWKIGKASTIKQVVRLAAGARRLDFETEVDWHEDFAFLKVEFPVEVRSQFATYEMQFGVTERPTHYNTSYDFARFE
ncbi:MAG TPA: glycoside hydrolase family 38 C-terminal domain-containing protein, partial [Fimbriimonadaceae bacterium]|nr:glycoside hydrolase family 38 C-terminal domain-containing protein [Fimbriimonadaceae bacterium]